MICASFTSTNRPKIKGLCPKWHYPSRLQLIGTFNWDSKHPPRFKCKSWCLHRRLKELVRGPEVQEEDIQWIRTMMKPLRCLTHNPNIYLWSWWQRGWHIVFILILRNNPASRGSSPERVSLQTTHRQRNDKVCVCGYNICFAPEWEASFIWMAKPQVD